MSLKYCLTEDFLLIEITFRILNLTNLHINFEIRYASAFAHVRKNSAIFIITLTYKLYLISNYQFFSSEIIYLTVLVSVELLFGSGRSVCVYRALCLIFPFLEKFYLCKSTRNRLK